MGKELWGHIDGSDPAPTEPPKLAQWQVKDARVMTWILGSIDQLLVPDLRPYRIAKDMWEYVRKVYNQDNTAKHFRLEYEIARYMSPVPTESLAIVRKLMGKVRGETCNKFNVLVARNTNILLAVVGSTTIDKSALTPEMVQQMIITTFLDLGLQGKCTLPSFSCLVDSDASNHMTNSSDTLSNVKKYYVNSQIANGNELPIHAIGNINSSIKDILVSP
ncbi:hypothetical protein FEM48_Zijuj07G0031600 [Ziziphus jujuba var. spinosa]|uniref:Uncharacterized protein n=1 Tax=Ziziphus jujuba var. spinosa TaxID=714518 RepID=A0A978V240_ZIZJJ|nr:hypothetical protein FEM48_Zijuj07G0031600 [Ziziphus jujuba var. spinosa]